jgi:RNA polymerase sigma-70 factor (ECF subfamily)
MPYESESDRELVARVIAGETEAFGTLHKRYHGKIYRLAYLQTHNEDDAKDIAAETFCRAFQQLRQFQFRAGESIYPWLHRIAANLAVDRCRDASSRRVVSLDAEVAGGIQTFLDRMEDTGPSPEEWLERHEVQMLVRSAIAALSPDQQETIVHRFLGELSVKEIAESMHRSEAAVKSLLHRGLVALREELIERLEKAGRIDLLAHGEEEINVRGDTLRIHRRTDETR